ncbi:hypothetical protein [Pelomonas sp. BJYL3]|uniref:hypothetical protein n=1 Tax=Pelomonas sp. BJYL3 TaxID=2976697 RepID=UPI0022B454C3|nr:hypothetical protein [Pelomonas sp. BJYL3]
MSSAAPARDAVGLATLAFFGLALGFIGLRGLYQGHFDHVVTWRGQPVSFSLRFIAWMLGCGLCLGLCRAVWRQSLAPDARLWQDTAPLPRSEPARMVLHERPRGGLRRLAGLAALLLAGLVMFMGHQILQSLLGPAAWLGSGPVALALAWGLLRWLLWRPRGGPLLILGPEGLQDLSRDWPPIPWTDIQALDLYGSRLQLALYRERRAQVLRGLGGTARWTALSMRWDGDGADVAIPLHALDGRAAEVLARARDWQGWAQAQPQSSTPARG